MSPLLAHVLVGAGAAAAGALAALAVVRRSDRVEDLVPPPAWPAVVAGALVAGALGGWSGARWIVGALAVLAGCAAALAAVDLRSRRLPDAMLAPTYLAVTPLVVLAAVVGGDADRLLRASAAAAVVGAAFMALKLARPSGIGLGDVKLAPLLGLVLGWFGWQQVLTGIFLAYLSAAVVVVVGLVTRRTGLRDDLPFGPYLLAATLLAAGLARG